MRTVKTRRLLRFILFFAILASASALSLGQQDSGPRHQHDNNKYIDGASEPQLIPDQVAYRLVFLAMSLKADASVEEIRNRQVHLAKLNMQEIDQLKLAATLDTFKSQYVLLVQNFNEEATASLAEGRQVDMTKFLSERDSLVDSTRFALRRGISPNALSNVEEYVQAEKNKMKIISPEAVAQ